MTGPEEQFDVVQRERKHYRDGQIAEDTAEVEDQIERISRALTSAPRAGAVGQSRPDEQPRPDGHSPNGTSQTEPTGNGA